MMPILTALFLVAALVALALARRGTGLLRPALALLALAGLLALIPAVLIRGQAMGGLIFGAWLSLAVLPLTAIGCGLLAGAAAHGLWSRGMAARVLALALLAAPPLSGVWLFQQQLDRDRAFRAALAGVQAQDYIVALGQQTLIVPGSPQITLRWPCATHGQCSAVFRNRTDIPPDYARLDSLTVLPARAACGPPDGPVGACLDAAALARWCDSRPDKARTPFCTAPPRHEITFLSDGAYSAAYSLPDHLPSARIGQDASGQPIPIYCAPERGPDQSPLCTARFPFAPGVEAGFQLDGLSRDSIRDEAEQTLLDLTALWEAMVHNAR